MFKKNILIVFFLLTASCGYEAIYSKKNSVNYGFSISSINFEGDRDVNLRIKQTLNNYVSNKNNKKFDLNIITINEKTIIAKDTAGDPTDFENTTNVNVEVFIEGKFHKKIVIKENFKYKNITNKFDLKANERNLKVNLAETIAKELVFRLSNI